MVDNDSADRTVAVAPRAGATLARSYRTEGYDELARIAAMNETMHAVTERHGAARTWWLWFDADEFPHGPRGYRSRVIWRRWMTTTASSELATSITSRHSRRTAWRVFHRSSSSRCATSSAPPGALRAP